MSRCFHQRTMRRSIAIGFGLFLGTTSAWAQSCATLDAIKAAQCRGLEQQEKILSTNCRVPGAATAEQAASLCAQARAKVQAQRSALFAGPALVPNRPRGDRSSILHPLPAAGGAQPKPPVLRGFYIGMPVNQALAAAAVALAPWQAVYVESYIGDSISVYLKNGPVGDSETLDYCADLQRRNGSTVSDLLLQCARFGRGQQFEFDVSKAGTISKIAIEPAYIRGSHGYNLLASGLSFDEFAQVLGKRLNTRPEFGQKEDPTTTCDTSVAGIYGSATCKTNRNEQKWYNINNVATCKCSMTLFATHRLFLVAPKTKDAEAIR